MSQFLDFHYPVSEIFFRILGDSHRLSGNGTLSLAGNPEKNVTSGLMNSFWQLEAAPGKAVSCHKCAAYIKLATLHVIGSQNYHLLQL